MQQCNQLCNAIMRDHFRIISITSNGFHHSSKNLGGGWHTVSMQIPIMAQGAGLVRDQDSAPGISWQALGRPWCVRGIRTVVWSSVARESTFGRARCSHSCSTKADVRSLALSACERPERKRKRERTGARTRMRERSRQAEEQEKKQKKKGRK